MKKPSSRINIRKAQNARRIIGVNRFLDRIKSYRNDAELWECVKAVFLKSGFILKNKEGVNEND